MSTRVRSEISPLVSTLIAYTIDDSSPLSHQSGNYGTSIYRDSQKTISDVVTSDYHARIKSGDIINNPMTLVHTEQEEPGGHFFYKNYEDSGFTWEWNVEPCYDWLALNHPSALVGAIERTWNNEDMVASAKLHALANIDPTPFSFAEDLAEIRTTARHLVQRGVSLKRLNDLYRKKDGSLKRKLKRSYNTSRKVRQEISSLWLEYRFAVSPLIRSITDLMDAANTKIVSRPPRLTSRGFESVDWDEEKKNSAGGSASYLGSGSHQTPER